MLVGNGTLGPLYIETATKYKKNIDDKLPESTYLEYIPPTKNKKDRRGERGFIAYLEKCFSLKTLSKGDLLLTDNEASFKTELVKDLESSKGIRS